MIVIRPSPDGAAKMPAEPTPKDTLLRQKLAEIIKASERTQLSLASDSGLPQSLISGILTGQRADLRAETVTRLWRALGRSPSSLGKFLFECFPE